MLAAEVCTHAQSPRRKEGGGGEAALVYRCTVSSSGRLSTLGKAFAPVLLLLLLPPFRPISSRPTCSSASEEGATFKPPLPPSPSPSRAFSLPHHGDTAAQTVVFSSSLDRPQGLNEHHTPSRCGKNGNNIIKRQNRDVPFGFAEVSPPFLLCLHFCVFRLSRAHVLAPSGISERGSPFAVRPPAAHPFAAPSA